MAGSSRLFDVEDFNKWKKRQGSSYKPPPQANFIAAANYIRNFFESKKLNWAVMLGLAMACLGSRREMMDLHVVYDDRDLNRIKMKLEADQRVRLPKGMNSLFPAKILVATGPRFKDAGCVEDVEVEVDLVPPGAYGTPPNDVLSSNQVSLRLKHEGKVEAFKGLNMLYLVKTTIAYCKNQDLAWDPKKDLLFLCQFYGREIELIRNQLSARQIQENFLGTPFVLRLPTDEQRRCYHIFLGADKNPPPSMSLTPAPPMGHRLTASTSDINAARPRIISHKSSPSLNTMQQSSNFLAPPLPGRPKKDQNLPRSAPPTSTSTSVPQATVTAPEQSPSRDSRSRYRHSSVPTTPNGMRSLSPEVKQPVGPRARSAERPVHPTAASTTQAKMVVTQRIHQPLDPVTKSGVPSLPISMRPQKSMPALAVRTVGPVPVFAHGQKAATSQNPKTWTPQTVPQADPLPNNTSPGLQGCAQSHERSRSQDDGVPRPSDARSMVHTVAQPHLPRLQDISQSRLTADNSGSASNRNTSTSNSGQHSTSVSDVHGQKDISLSAPKLREQSQSRSQTSTVKPSLENQQTPSSAFIYELEASPQEHITALPPGPPSDFIAELPGDIGCHLSLDKADPLPKVGFGIGTEPEHTKMAHVCTGQPNAMSRTPPHGQPQALGHFSASPPQTTQPVGSLQSNTPPATSNMLPSSLMIGYRRNTPVKSTSQHLPRIGDAPPNVNAQKYSTPFYSNSTDLPASMEKTTVSQYKAYSGPISPPVQPSEFVNHHQRQPNNQITQLQYHDVSESTPGQAQRVHQHHPGNYVYQPFSAFGNLPTPPVSDFEVSKRSPNPPAYRTDVGTSTSAPAASATDRSRNASHDDPTVDKMSQERETSSQFLAFQPGVAYPPRRHSPPAILSIITPKESNFLRMSRPVLESGHQRSASRDSQSSTSSHDSEKLAQEYQAHLPDLRSRFDDDEVHFR